MADRIQIKQVAVNNIPITVQGETVKMVRGRGDSNFEAQVAGGGAVEVIQGIDTTTQVGMISFEMAFTSETQDYIDNWHDNRTLNVVQVTARNGTIYTLEKASLTSDPETPFSSDGNITIEFKGNPIK